MTGTTDRIYRCPACMSCQLQRRTVAWLCLSCDNVYACSGGIPYLLVSERISGQDVDLIRSLYTGWIGRLHDVIMGIAGLPKWSLRRSWKLWIVYTGVVTIMALSSAYVGLTIYAGPRTGTVVALGLLASLLLPLSRDSRGIMSLILAVPTKISLLLRRFKPEVEILRVHENVFRQLSGLEPPIQVLDVGSGGLDALYKHGWIDLDGVQLTALDLSQTMLERGQRRATDETRPLDLVIGDAHNLPFCDGVFHAVLSYGAMNSFSRPRQAMLEIARVLRPGGIMVFYDEQLHASAGFIERTYFKQVLTKHDIVDRCPVEKIPDAFQDVEVYQVREFYYICVCRKS